jgi:uroporphyrinogen-III synthase
LASEDEVGWGREDAVIRVILTRPAADSAPLAEILTARGVAVLIDPMLTIAFAEDASLDMDGVQGILFTSANGVRAYCAVTPRRDLPVFAVGDRTADAARSSGFKSVSSAKGDIHSLAAIVREQMTPTRGALLHPAGSAVAGDLAGILGESGYEVRRAVLYEARQADVLSAETRAALCEGRIDMILFYSPRTAAAFVRLVAGLESACAKVEILCLSQAVADAAGALPWRRVIVAENPTQADVLTALDERLNGS